MLIKRSFIGLTILLVVSAASFAQGGMKGDEVNLKPLRDLAAQVNTLVGQNKLDLNAPFLLSASATLGDEGKIIPSSYKVIKKEGLNAQMLLTLNSAIKALGESGYLKEFALFGVKNMQFQIAQTADSFSLAMQSDMASFMQSTQVRLYFAGQLQLAEARTQQTPSQVFKDELMLLKATTVKADEKKLSITTVLPKKDFHELLDRKLKEQKTN